MPLSSESPYRPSPAPPSWSRPAWVAVDLGALVRNLRYLRCRVTGAKILAVVKADAYGHGAPQVARALEEGGIDWLGVALVEEGLKLRRAGVTMPILILGTVQAAQLPLIRRLQLTPTLSSLEQLALWSEWGGDTVGASTSPQGVHLKVDTGMGRLGIAPSDLPHALSSLRQQPWLRLEGLLSHLAQADDPESGCNESQEAQFLELLRYLTSEENERVILHLANSAAALHRPSSHHNLVRLGLALYGLDPAHAVAELEPVMSIHARIVHLNQVKPGEAVGYGGKWTAARPSSVAVVPVGYADGYPWRLGQGAEALVAGKRVPVIGAVSMDMLALDVTDTEYLAVRVGSEVVLMGRQGDEEISAWALAGWAGTIPYEILCGFGLRLPRRYPPS